MKWFKHMCASSDDEKLAALIGKGGMQGLALYGAYWRVAEIVALQIEKTSTTAIVSYPTWRWAQKLFVRKSDASSLLLRLKKEGLLVLKGDPKCDETVTVEMPNLLKYRDEYSRKSGHAPDNVAPDTEGDTEAEKEEDKKTIAPSLLATEPNPTDSTSETVISIPATGKKTYAVTKAQVEHWSELFPAVDVMQQLRAMVAWSESNPTKRKTTSGMFHSSTTVRTPYVECTDKKPELGTASRLPVPEPVPEPDPEPKTNTRSPKTAPDKPSPECLVLYKAYPRHTAPKDAYRAISKALAERPFDEILIAVNKFAKKVKQDGTEEKYIPHPATWFNAGRYDDEELKAVTPKRTYLPAGNTPAEWRALIADPEAWKRAEIHDEVEQ